MMITDTDSMERSLTTVQNTDGDIVIVYNKVETIMTTKQVEIGGAMMDVEVPVAGKTDLCAVRIPIEGDLAVSADITGIIVDPKNETVC